MRRTLITAAAACALVATPPAAAQEDGWRVAVAGDPVTMGDLRDVGATGANDAWVTRIGLPLLRWNGSAWNGSAGTAVPYLLTAVGPREVWQFVETPAKLDARRWDGRQWRGHPIAEEGAHATAALATAPGECWVSGLRLGPRGMEDVVWRWTGTSWGAVRAPLPITDFAAASRTDVWALSSLGAESADHVASILRWTGAGWREVPVPSMALPVRSRAGDAYAELNDIVVVRPDEAYAVGGISFIIGEDRVVREAIVLRWDGRAWRRLAHRPAETAYTRVAPDGAGGLWLATRRQDRPDVLTHYEDGRWSRVPVPLPPGTTGATVRGLANVPGTGTMWATAEARGPAVTRQLILSNR